MRTLVIIMLSFCANNLFAQKPVIDAEAYANWQSLGMPVITSNGKFLSYSIRNVTSGSYTWVLQSSDGKWKKELINQYEGVFTADSRSVLFIKHNNIDSLAILTLGTDQIKYIPNVSSFELNGRAENEILSYQPSGNAATLILKNLKTNQEYSYNNVTGHQYTDSKKALILYQSSKLDQKAQIISWVDPGSGKSYKIWEGKEIENLVIDSKYNQLAFTLGDSLFHYKVGATEARCLMRSISSEVKDNKSFGSLYHFSKDGTRVFIYLMENENQKPVADAVEIWNYRDPVLQSEQEKVYWSRTCLAILDLENRRIINLQQNVKESIIFPGSEDDADTLALVNLDNGFDERWNVTRQTTWYLVNTKTGERKKLDFLDNIRNTTSISSSGKYLVYYSFKDQDYFTYEIATGVIRNLSQGLNISWKDLQRDDLFKTDLMVYPRSADDAVWLKNDESLLVYDTYDIWKLDPLSKEKPVNLTNGYGKKHHIVFNFTFNKYNGSAVDKEGKIYLNAFDTESKDNGFYLKQLNKTGDPDRLFMGPYIFCTNSSYITFDVDFSPVKAKNEAYYIVRRMSATEFPNYYSTKDFKIFTRLSDVNPQKKYNWYTTELHTWKSLDGRMLKGILYKPENFDPNKKYPVIFQYYERKSDGLNAFIKPEPLCGGCNLNQPTFVSQGYLVFCPDIYYKVGDPMQGTHDALVSAGKYLSGLSYVNRNKMGIHGCSWGGFQTNYLVTHTDLFAAAVSSSGVADWIGAYGSFHEDGKSQQEFYETGSPRMGESIWQNPGAYINNSSIFQVDKVRTPVLFMHTKKDDICPYGNVQEFFNGLRRTGKKAWMLVYSKGNHGLNDEYEVADFSKRMMQFFDHYLKDKPAPVWMTKGIAASRRGLDNGYEYDTEINTPGPGLLKPEEKQIMDSLMTEPRATVIIR